MKKLAAFFVLVTLVLNSQIPTSGLIGAWTFSGNANDVSGNGNNGTVVNAVLTTDRCGNANGAYYFNGYSSYIRMINGGPLGNAARSVSFWVKTTNTWLAPAVAFDYGFIGWNQLPSCWQVVSNYNCFGLGVDVSTYAVQKGPACFNDGTWHHVAIVFNPTISAQVSSTFVYIDGVVQSQNCDVGTPAAVNTQSLQPVTIGRSAHASDRFFFGTLDDFYFYNVALTSTEVMQLYQASNCFQTIIGNSVFCSGIPSNSIYSIAPIPGASYVWNVPFGWIGSSNTNTISLNSGTNSGTLSVVVTRSCGAPRTFSLLLSVGNIPTVTAVSIPNILCTGNNASISATGGTSYTLNSANIFSNSIVISPTITTNYTITGFNNGCINQTVLTVSVSNLPNILASANPSIICQGNSSTVTAIGGINYTLNTGPIFSNTTQVSPTITTSYTVSGTDNNGCLNQFLLPITVNNLPLITASSSKTLICTGYNAVISATGGISYTLIPGNSFTSSTIVSPNVTTNYSLVGLGLNGCKNQTLYTLTVSECTEVEEHLLKDGVLDIYPNPFNNEFTLHYRLPFSSIKVFDIFGKEIFSKLCTSNFERINLDIHPKGIYYLMVGKEGGYVMKKIIKE